MSLVLEKEVKGKDVGVRRGWWEGGGGAGGGGMWTGRLLNTARVKEHADTQWLSGTS